MGCSVVHLVKRRGVAEAQVLRVDRGGDVTKTMKPGTRLKYLQPFKVVSLELAPPGREAVAWEDGLRLKPK